MIKDNKIIFKVPRIYKAKVFKIKQLKGKHNPFVFIEKFCRLKGLGTIIVIHKPLKLAAEFKLPNKILVDFHNSLNYICLCLAHEYAHILLRDKIFLPYPIEQSLAILLQLTYENYAQIRKFEQKNVRELMQLMNVWLEGRKLSKQWPFYWHQNKSRDNQYTNILVWLKEKQKQLKFTIKK